MANVGWEDDGFAGETSEERIKSWGVGSVGGCSRLARGRTG